jgi:hypothetical protein
MHVGRNRPTTAIDRLNLWLGRQVKLKLNLRDRQRFAISRKSTAFVLTTAAMAFRSGQSQPGLAGRVACNGPKHIGERARPHRP